MGSYTQIMKKKMYKNHILQFVLLICLACARGDANVCQAVRTEEGCRPTIDMNNFQIPEDFDLERVVEEVTKGSGWIVLKSMYSSEDVKLAKDIVYQYNKADNITMDRNDDARHKSRDEAHNKYNGLVWALFNKGRIFEKMAQHPVILNISNVILGESSIISSYAANTVLPGQGGQLPHLDYPYYRAFYPSTNPNIMDTAPPLSMQFVTLLTDFTKDNGGTALRPISTLTWSRSRARLATWWCSMGQCSTARCPTRETPSGRESCSTWHRSTSNHLKPWRSTYETT